MTLEWLWTALFPFLLTLPSLPAPVLLLFPADTAQSIRCSVSSSTLLLFMPSFPTEWTTVILFSFVFLKSIFLLLNAAATLIVRLPHSSHMSSYFFDHLHWLPSWFVFNLCLLLLIDWYSSGLVPKYRTSVISSTCWFRSPHFDPCAHLNGVKSLFHGQVGSVKPTSSHDLLIASSRGLTAYFWCVKTVLFLEVSNAGALLIGIALWVTP